MGHPGSVSRQVGFVTSDRKHLKKLNEHEKMCHCGDWFQRNRWIAARLSMGHEVSVTRAARRFRDDPKTARKLKDLVRKLGLC